MLNGLGPLSCGSRYALCSLSPPPCGRCSCPRNRPYISGSEVATAHDLTSAATPSKMPATMRLQTLYEARWIFAVLGLLGVVSCFVSLWLLLPLSLLFAYTLWFFRDPERLAPADPDAILAAADGTV